MAGQPATISKNPTQRRIWPIEPAATALLWISKMSLEVPRTSFAPGNEMPADSTMMPARAWPRRRAQYRRPAFPQDPGAPRSASQPSPRGTAAARARRGAHR
jgi:hypothetical protein